MKFVFVAIIISLVFSCKGDDPVTPKAGQKHMMQTEIPEIVIENIPEIHTINFKEDTLIFLALGDSYTIGAGVGELDRWPNQLTSSLGNLNIQVKKPTIIATSGWTTTNLIEGIERSNLTEKYDMVSLLIGVNNQYQGVPFATFQNEFIKLLEISFEKAKSKSSVFVLSIPDYGVTPFGGGLQSISDEIDMYNEWISEVCSANKIKFYDITELSRNAKKDLSLLAPDQLHPSGKMYASWVNLITYDLPELLLQ
jgi:lysophospholipase L1-like esterase